MNVSLNDFVVAVAVAVNKCHNISHTEFVQIFHKSEISNTLLKISLAQSSVTSELCVCSIFSLI